MDVQSILKTSEPRLKQNRRPELRKATKDPPLAILVFLTSIFFGTMRLLFENCLIAPKCRPSFFFDILQQNGC